MSEPAPVSVLVVDDDAMVRGWVRAALEGTEFRIAGEAGTAAEGFELVDRRNPDVLLVDYRLTDGVGTEFVRELRMKGVGTPAVIMTAHVQRGMNEAAREAGAQGTVLKSARLDELIEALRGTTGGQGFWDDRHPRRPPGRGPLTPREREVLRLIASGKTSKEAAEELQVGSETVKTLLSRAFTKLGVRRRSDAVAVAQGKGLL